jgi:hypothetical protein
MPKKKKKKKDAAPIFTMLTPKGPPIFAVVHSGDDEGVEAIFVDFNKAVAKVREGDFEDGSYWYEIAEFDGASGHCLRHWSVPRKGEPIVWWTHPLYVEFFSK